MITDPTQRLATDSKNLDSLRQSAHQNSPDAIKAAAQQFEALFMNSVMKSMREASTPMESGLFDNSQSKMFTGMLDQQLSQNMAKKGVGLADVLIRQLSPAGMPTDESMKAKGNQKFDAANLSASLGNVGRDVVGNVGGVARKGEVIESADSVSEAMAADDIGSLLHGLQNLQSALPGADGKTGKGLQDVKPLSYEDLKKVGQARKNREAVAVTAQPVVNNPANRTQPAHVRQFQEKLGAQAAEASRLTGIPAKFLLGQAALESGWGRREITAKDGTPSHNLFGIKAGNSWKGKVVETNTVEYVNGAPQIRREKFRAYDSYADAFRDYAKLLAKNPRYENVIANSQDASSFARGLQRAGYATDPNYAAKLTRIINNSLT